jgi:RNA polymerase sigma-70 factor (ECF subfamily)
MSQDIDDSFLRAVEPLRPALRLHCYRMLGSSSDGDDVMQEVLLRAWRAKDSLEDATAIRPWLYRIATNACLDELRHRKERPLPSDVVPAAADPTAPPLPASPEATWLEPLPDAWLAGAERDPGAAYELRESVALAFVAALQCLSAQQRAVLLLRDVLGMRADEAAAALGITISAANSALHRARTALRERIGGSEEQVAIDATSDVDDELLAKYIRAWDSLDLPALVALLHDDILVSMPPSPTWLRGKAAASSFLAVRPFVALAKTTRRIVTGKANGQPALVFYVGGALHAVQVLRLHEGRVLEAHHFCDEKSFAAFRLPPTLEEGEEERGGAMKDTETRRRARAACDAEAGRVLATVEVLAPPERVFRALTSDEIVRWWVRPGVFDTTEWTGDVRPGGRWRAAGNARGKPYAIDGEFLQVESPWKVVHTWHPFESAAAPTTVTCVVEAAEGGARITLRHEGFAAREACINTAIGWKTSLERLAELVDGRIG